jgi:hypothetical protein
MIIDEMNYDQCWRIWSAINNAPVKAARALFPHRPPQYVTVTKLIGSYAANKGTALGLANKRTFQIAHQGIDGVDINERIKVYDDIAAEIWCRIPAWANDINIDKGEINCRKK